MRGKGWLAFVWLGLAAAVVGTLLWLSTLNRRPPRVKTTRLERVLVRQNQALKTEFRAVAPRDPGSGQLDLATRIEELTPQQGRSEPNSFIFRTNVRPKECWRAASRSNPKLVSAAARSSMERGIM